MHPEHESACSAQIFRLAFPSHVFLMAGQCVVQGGIALAAPPSSMMFWALASLFRHQPDRPRGAPPNGRHSACSTDRRVVLTIVMLQDCALHRRVLSLPV